MVRLVTETYAYQSVDVEGPLFLSKILLPFFVFFNKPLCMLFRRDSEYVGLSRTCKARARRTTALYIWRFPTQNGWRRVVFLLSATVMGEARTYQKPFRNMNHHFFFFSFRLFCRGERSSWLVGWLVPNYRRIIMRTSSWVSHVFSAFFCVFGVGSSYEILSPWYSEFYVLRWEIQHVINACCHIIHVCVPFPPTFSMWQKRNHLRSVRW